MNDYIIRGETKEELIETMSDYEKYQQYFKKKLKDFNGTLIALLIGIFTALLANMIDTYFAGSFNYPKVYVITIICIWLFLVIIAIWKVLLLKFAISFHGFFVNQTKKAIRGEKTFIDFLNVDVKKNSKLHKKIYK